MQDEVEKLRIDIAKLDSEYKVKAQALEKASARREAEEKAKHIGFFCQCLYAQLFMVRLMNTIQCFGHSSVRAFLVC